jgi:corrinoid protein of di/trimethylamine methyltransferase
MSCEIILEAPSKALLELNSEKTMTAVRDCIDSGCLPAEIIKSLAGGMIKIGEKFESREYFLPQLTLAAKIMAEANEFIAQNMVVDKSSGIGTIVIGTIHGDIHDLGKNIVAGMLTSAGFEVHDLGRDVPISKFIDAAKEKDADIIACSALMSVTMPFMGELIKMLNDTGMGDKYKVLVGGAPLTQEYADQIGADGYAADAQEAINTSKKLISA